MAKYMENPDMFQDPMPGFVDQSVAPQEPWWSSFHLIQANGNSSVRKNLNGAPGGPNALRISHTEVGKGASRRVRHLVRLDAKQVESVQGVEYPSGEPTTTLVEGAGYASCYLVVDAPLGGERSPQLYGLIAQLIGILRGNDGGARCPVWGDALAGEFEAGSFVVDFLNGMV